MANAHEKVTFTGSLGEELAARLEQPAGKPKAHALFAHCFSCSKDVLAAARIAGALAAQGIAVLRFDFTGLGHSEGDFANTNFSSNVGDLVCAADYLRKEHQAPALLIGHSFGGAAALIAALDIPECKAVATIAAPADAEHVTHAFKDSLADIERTGEAEVSLAGRAFRIRKQFLDDLKNHKVQQAAAALRRALLVCHAPLDRTVSVDNATAIFVAAKHPKSFLSLDTADHLLTRRQDAAYAADVIAAWSGRYLGPAAAAAASVDLPATGTGEVVVREGRQGPYDAAARAGLHLLRGDQPKEVGGLDTGPNPYDYMAIALGLCTTQTLRMYADHKGLALGRTTVRLHYDKIYTEDCKNCVEGKGIKKLTFQRELELEGNLSDAQAQRLRQIADKCPVHKAMQENIPIHTTIKHG